jgi:phytanoyl-CoA hydroxylase
MNMIARYFEAHKDQVHAPPLQKGDVLFWSSRIIHGSLPTKNTSFSRKSLTAHYLPSQYQFGRRNVDYPETVKYSQGVGMKFREPGVLHTRYSPWAKFLTDVFQYMHGSPALRDAAARIAKMARR